MNAEWVDALNALGLGIESEEPTNPDEMEDPGDAKENETNNIGDMHISESGIGFLKSAEGHRNDVYADIFGNLTAAWGHELKGKELQEYKAGDVIPMETQIAWLKSDLITAEDAVKKTISNNDISQSQFDALVDLAYNTGHVGKTLGLRKCWKI